MSTPSGCYCYVRHTKGHSQRSVPLPQATLDALREYWKTHRHPQWLFPGRADLKQIAAAITIGRTNRPLHLSRSAPLRDRTDVYLMIARNATRLLFPRVCLRQACFFVRAITTAGPVANRRIITTRLRQSVAVGASSHATSSLAWHITPTATRSLRSMIQITQATRPTKRLALKSDLGDGSA